MNFRKAFFELTLFLFWPFVLYSQSLSDCAIQFVNKIPEQAKLIGLGEANHGSEEFTLMRAEICRQLIKKNRIQAIVLEASYYDCKRINDYVLNRNSDTVSLFCGIWWPWKTKSMLRFLNELRIYNLTCKTEDKVFFLGMDKGVNLMHQAFCYPDFWYTVPWIRNFKSKVNTCNEPNCEKKAILQLYKERSYLHERDDSLEALAIIETLYFETLSKPQRYKHRELFMAEMVSHLLNQFANNKSLFIWAHNAHIAYKHSSRKNCGYYMKKQWKDKAFLAAMFFTNGSFRAVNTDSVFNKNFRYIQSFDIPKNYNLFSIDNYKLLNENEMNNREKVWEIGAAFSVKTLYQKPDFFQQKYKLKHSFDAVIYVPTTTPSEDVKGLNVIKVN